MLLCHCLLLLCLGDVAVSLFLLCLGNVAMSLFVVAVFRGFCYGSDCCCCF